MAAQGILLSRAHDESRPWCSLLSNRGQRGGGRSRTGLVRIRNSLQALYKKFDTEIECRPIINHYHWLVVWRVQRGKDKWFYRSFHHYVISVNAAIFLSPFVAFNALWVCNILGHVETINSTGKSDLGSQSMYSFIQLFNSIRKMENAKKWIIISDMHCFFI